MAAKIKGRGREKTEAREGGDQKNGKEELGGPIWAQELTEIPHGLGFLFQQQQLRICFQLENVH